jgi:hypothetical protein
VLPTLGPGGLCRLFGALARQPSGDKKAHCQPVTVSICPGILFSRHTVVSPCGDANGADEPVASEVFCGDIRSTFAR